MIFNIDYAMKHSYSNDDTCFRIDVIDEILEEDFDSLLDEGSKILHFIEGTLLEEEIFAEFDEFMAMTADEKSDFECDTEEEPFEKITINTDYKIKTSLEEPLTDLELKPLPDNLEYVFLEEPSFLPVIISSKLFKEKKNKLVFLLKKHNEAFSWKTTNIPGSSNSDTDKIMARMDAITIKMDAQYKKQLNLGVGTERMIFNIDSTMNQSYSNDDTFFSIDVIDEILEEDFDALLDEGSKILHSIEGTHLEEEIFAESDEFMAMTVDESSDFESDTEEPPFEKITINTDYKIKTSLEEPPTDFELKSLPNNLEYVFLEEPSFLPVIISSHLSKEKKNKLVSVLKNIRKPLPGKQLTFLVSILHYVNKRYNFWMTRN
uniref:Reverse transcriptase domain-containing protein n=1 Tax=Tanacetum cinerariifolium TaxID=118510 RepID=A0A6L2JU70_TANCI|nr:reverse transcriptase domain-containing protein [Tanacetum cinerariifolium]